MLEDPTDRDLVRAVLERFPGDQVTCSDWRRRQRTRRFIEQGGRCFYCGCDCILMLNVPSEFKPDNLATLEHLYDRFDPRRREASSEPHYVMACHRCNFDRGVASQASQPLEELHRRANMHGAKKALRKKNRAGLPPDPRHEMPPSAVVNRRNREMQDFVDSYGKVGDE